MFLPKVKPPHEISKDFSSYLGRIHQAGATDITIISHSMGGLISRDALTQLQNALPASTTLITIATPIRGSNMGGSLDHILGMVFGVPLWFVSIFTDEPVLYDRHLFDMRPLSRNLGVGSYYMRSLSLEWHNFLKRAASQVTVFSIIGTKSGLFDRETTDSVVAVREAGFGEVPQGRRCYVNKRHFNDIAKIESPEHPSYRIIMDIAKNPRRAKLDCDVPKEVEMTWAIFIRPDASAFRDLLFFDIDSDDPNPPPFLPFLNYPVLRYIDAGINFLTVLPYMPYYIPFEARERKKPDEERLYKRVFGDYAISKHAACGTISRYTSSGEKKYRVMLSAHGEELPPISWKCSLGNTIIDLPRNETSFIEMTSEAEQLVLSYGGKSVRIRPEE